MKIIQYPLPDISTMEVTQTAENIGTGEGEVDVVNTAGFTVNDYIVIEKVGNEMAEMQQVDVITPATQTLSFVSTTMFGHYSGTCVRKTPFNQARLYRSTDNVTYTLTSTASLNWQDKYGLITFIDNTGSDAYWYKVEYWNSTTSVGIMSSPIKTQTDTGFISVEDFKNETGLEGENEQISIALRYAAENVGRNLYVQQYAEFITPDTNFIINTSTGGCGYLEFADANFNGQIDKNDFVVWEQAQDGTRTYVTSDIVAIDVDRHRITFGSTHPTGSNKLVMEYYVTFRKLSELTFKIRRLQTLYAVNYIYQNIPIKRLQRGISSWSLNGVSITFDFDTMNKISENNKKEISILLREIAKLYTRFTPIHSPTTSKPWIKSTLRWQSDNVPVVSP